MLSCASFGMNLNIRIALRMSSKICLNVIDSKANDVEKHQFEDLSKEILFGFCEHTIQFNWTHTLARSVFGYITIYFRFYMY